jgi:hypothetical protein
MTSRHALAFAAIFTLATSLLSAARPPFDIELRFTPTTATGAAAPAISPKAVARTLTLEVADARPGSDPAVVGQGTDDDDSTFPVKATTELAAFARETFSKLAAEWGLRLGDDGEMSLKVSVTKWFVNEQNQAVGSMYAAEVGLRAELSRRDGAVAWRGVASGDTRRYGKKQSVPNHNECMSDAAQEALANLLSDPELQSAMERGGAGTESAAREPKREAPAEAEAAKATDPDVVLAEVVALQQKGFSPGFLLEFVKKKAYTRVLSTDDLVKWKEAGLSEAVIMGAMEASR